MRVVSGDVDAQGTRRWRLVRACQATIEGDAEILFDEVPVPAKRQGTLAAMRWLSHEVAEVVVRLNSPFTYLPGQYVKAAFAGFPSRDYSPTAYLDGGLDDTELVFHIKRYEGGVVSAALGHTIRLGHKVTVNGPYGHAFYREAASRLVLVASGTGWAPIWSVARAARLAEPEREIVVIAGARDPRNLYMGQSVDWLSASGVRDIVLTASGNEGGDGIRFGRPTEFLPELTLADTVYAAGAPAMVDAVKLLADELRRREVGHLRARMDEDRRGQAQDRGVDRPRASSASVSVRATRPSEALPAPTAAMPPPDPMLGGIVTSVALSMRLNAVLSAFRTSMPSPVPTTGSSEPKASTGQATRAEERIDRRELRRMMDSPPAR